MVVKPAAVAEKCAAVDAGMRGTARFQSSRNGKPGLAGGPRVF
jgi:hypothetical protein